MFRLPEKIIKPTIITTLFNAIFFLKEPFVAILAATIIPDPRYLSLAFMAMPIAILLFSPILGAMSDRVGRKRIIFFGIVCEIFAVFIYMISSHWWEIVLAKALEGIAFIAVGLISLAKVEDKLSDGNRGFMASIFLSITQIGYVLSPLAGAWIVDTYPLRILFYVCFDLCLVLMLFAFLMYRAKGKASFSVQDLQFFAPMKRFLSDRVLRGMGIMGFVSHSAAPAMYLFLPLFIIDEMGFTTAAVGTVFFFFGLFRAFQFVGGYFADRIGRKEGVLAGMGAKMIALFMIGYAHSFVFLCASVLLFSFGFSLWNSGATSDNIARDKEK